ncbi:MAG: T9SS type A sorting domain-containing protein, partial [Bacteroidales bacterium]|nr:T9SS type A sorting domain-containing protein [Bacteroidales bacterium]
INTEGIITLLKTDFSGNIIWKKSYITWGWGNSNNLTTGLLFSSNNHYIFVFGDEMLMSSGIIETDTTGSIIFSNELILNPSGITETDNNEYLIYGNGPVYGEKNINSSNENIGLIQIDSTGNEQDCMWATTSDTTNIDFISEAIDFNVTDEGVLSHIPIDIYSDDISVNTGCIYVYGSIEYNENITNVIISPNPGFGNYNVEISIPLYGNFTVYNCFGQIVYQTSVNGKNFNFDISEKANGVYFFKLLSNNKIYRSGKFFKISK